MLTTRREFILQTTAAGVLAAAGVPIARSTTDAMPKASGVARTGIVQTVLGPLDASKLGFTLTHEHPGRGSEKVFPTRAGSLAHAVDKLKEARDEGVDTVVDLTASEGGRDIRFLEELSRKSGMQIVACTGQRLFPPAYSSERTTEELTEFFIKEIVQGIDGTDIKAGVIKAGCTATWQGKKSTRMACYSLFARRFHI